jgi:AcrR family transcriptional regulator
MATRATPIREARERELIAATRALFDQRGMQDAPIEEIAQAVGIARGLIYRHFASKEELFVLTVTDYLSELGGVLADAAASGRGSVAQLERVIEAYASYCRRYPAYLHAIVSESVWLRLGQGMARCLSTLSDVLRRGNESGEFAVADPDYLANVLWTQTLGAMHLARIGVGVRQAAPDVPELFKVQDERIVRTCVASAIAVIESDAARLS